MRYCKTQIGDLVTLRQGFAINKKTNHHMSDEPTQLHLLRIGDMKDGNFSIFVRDTIPEKFIAKENDIIYTRTGQVGLVFRNQYGVVHNNCFTVTSNDEEVLSQQYLYYALQEESFYEEANSRATGAAQPDLPHGAFNSIEVFLPPIEAQRKITYILDSYNRLIDNNQKQIKLLEEAAQRLYKEWFVDLRFPGYESVEIIDGIPKGWEKCELNDFCYVTDGTHDSPKPKDYGIPLVTGKCIKNGYIDYSEANLISVEDHEKITKRSGLKTGDILFSNIGTIGSTCRVDYDREFSVKNVIILKPDTVAQTNFLYCWINSRYIQDTFLNQTNGSSQQFIGLSFMRKFGMIVPTSELIEKFNNLVSTLFMRKDLLHRQTEQLGEMRDRLLPKLMRGEIEV